MAAQVSGNRRHASGTARLAQTFGKEVQDAEHSKRSVSVRVGGPLHCACIWTGNQRRRRRSRKRFQRRPCCRCNRGGHQSGHWLYRQHQEWRQRRISLHEPAGGPLLSASIFGRSEGWVRRHRCATEPHGNGQYRRSDCRRVDYGGSKRDGHLHRYHERAD